MLLRSTNNRVENSPAAIFWDRRLRRAFGYISGGCSRARKIFAAAMLLSHPDP